MSSWLVDYQLIGQASVGWDPSPFGHVVAVLHTGAAEPIVVLLFATCTA